MTYYLPKDWRLGLTLKDEVDKTKPTTTDTVTQSSWTSPQLQPTYKDTAWWLGQNRQQLNPATGGWNPAPSTPEKILGAVAKSAENPWVNLAALPIMGLSGRGVKQLPMVSDFGLIGGEEQTYWAGQSGKMLAKAGKVFQGGGQKVPKGGLPKEVPKEPWQMTSKDFVTQRESETTQGYKGLEGLAPKLDKGWRKRTAGAHEQLVADALSEGKPVPPEVLKDYPDLAKTVPKPVTPEVTVPAVETTAIKPNLMEGVKPLGIGDIASGWQQTFRGRMIFKTDVAIENAKETLVFDKITSAPSYPKLIAAYKRFQRTLYGKDDPYMLNKIQEMERQPWELLTAHGGVMNAKSGTAKTLKSLADAVFSESKLPRNPEGKFRGESGLNWDAVKVKSTAIPETGKIIPKEGINIAKEPIIPTQKVAESVPPVKPPSEPPVALTPEQPIQPIKAEETLNQEVVDKLIGILEQAKTARPLAKATYQQELGKKASAVAGLAETAKGKTGLFQMKGAMKGGMEGFTPETQMTEPEVDRLFDMIWSSDLKALSKPDTGDALLSLLSGKLPQPHEIKSLEYVFGEQLTKVLTGAGGINWAKNIMETLNLPRAVLASFDLSGWLRQGGILVGAHPISGTKSFVSSVKAFASEQNMIAVDKAITSRPWFKLGEQSGLYKAPLPLGKGAALSKMEESFMTRFARYIPGVKQSERAYVTVLNDIRSRVWNQTIEMWSKAGATEQDYRGLASFINAATGRGNLSGQLGAATPFLNNIFFSPRLQISRLQVPTYLFNPAVSRKVKLEAARTLGRSIGVVVGLLTLAKLGGAEVGVDPRSSDFGKIKIGNTRLDFWTGYAQWARLVAQLSTGKRVTTTTGEIQDVNRWNTLVRFGQSKFSPIMGLLADLMTGKTYAGEEMKGDTKSVLTQIKNRLAPLSAQDFIDAMVTDGVKGALPSTLSFLGVGVVTYSSDTSTSKSKKINYGGSSDTTTTKKPVQKGSNKPVFK